MAVTIYKANDKYNAVLSSGYTVGQSTLSVSAVPDNVPTIVVLAKGTDNETVFSVTGKTINSLTGAFFRFKWVHCRKFEESKQSNK